MSDMSTVTTFTVRDLNRQPAKILAAVRKFGCAEVRTRNGEVFTIEPKIERKKKKFDKGFKALWARQRELGLVPPSEEENERINRIIAGEE
ncbi:MAG: hypothetical protein RL088_1700 [Verrucomicrobiota bacterium]|jgi:hypothetical protein